MKRFSLRGKVNVSDNGVTANHRVFDYVSPDRTRSWKVIEAYVWPVDWWGVTLADDGFMIATAALATDTGKFNQNEMCDPTENRMFAWAMQTYNTREAAAAVDFITPNATALGNMRMLVDPDHLITKELYINFANTSDTDVSQVREWGWLILLEERRISAVQSVFQQIKGMGQDIGESR
jgi:hypothetical protein